MVSIMRRLPLLILLVVAVVGSVSAAKRDSRLKMWYDYPADEFIESLVMGNGQMGEIGRAHV